MSERHFASPTGRPHRSPAGRSASPSTARRYEGLQGDTLASALLANGVHLVGRSFKYHRPRGILSAGSEEPNALVDSRARRGALHAEPARDAGRALRRARPRARTAGRRSPSMSARSTISFSPLLPAGFYYKTFMWPQASWKTLYEPSIRARRRSRPRAGAARSGPLSAAATPIATCWWSAPGRRASRRRLAAAETGARVILCDEQAELGGSLLDERDVDDRRPGGRTGWRRRSRRSRRWPMSRCCRAPRRSAIIAHNFVGLAERVTDHLAAPDPRCRASGCGRCAPSRWCSPPAPSSGRWFPGQRPPGHHAGRCGAHLSSTATASSRANAPSSSPRTTAPMRRRSICRRPASRSPRLPIARRPARPLDRARQRARHRGAGRPPSSQRRAAAAGIRRASARRDGRSHGGAERSPAICC